MIISIRGWTRREGVKGSERAGDELVCVRTLVDVRTHSTSPPCAVLYLAKRSRFVPTIVPKSRVARKRFAGSFSEIGDENARRIRRSVETKKLRKL